MAKLGVQWQLTIAERPQSHGTERSVGKVLEAIRFILADDGIALQWSEPAVLAVTQHQLNCETNEETGYTPYDLVFGKSAIKNIPDMSNTGAAAPLATYLDNLTQHRREIRAQSHLRRTKRQAQRLEANDPPGNHYYLAGDLVSVRNESHLLLPYPAGLQYIGVCIVLARRG